VILVGVELGAVKAEKDAYVWMNPGISEIFTNPLLGRRFDPTSVESIRSSSGYGYNYTGFGKWSSPTWREDENKALGHISIDQVKNPSRKIVVGESNGDGEWDTLLSPNWTAAEPSDLYRQGGHYLYADFHVGHEKKHVLLENPESFFNPLVISTAR
jgi:hypothetical protein